MRALSTNRYFMAHLLLVLWCCNSKGCALDDKLSLN
jgi:hypothetical protein